MTPVSKDALWTRINSVVAMIDYDNYRYEQTNPTNRHVQYTPQWLPWTLKASVCLAG